MVDVLVDHPELGLHFDGRELHAPVTIDAEVVHALRRRWIRDELTSVDVRARLDLLMNAAIRRHQVVGFIQRMWELRHNVTAYDAGYVVLAESLNIPLLTRDRRLARSSGHTARIEYID